MNKNKKIIIIILLIVLGMGSTYIFKEKQKKDVLNEMQVVFNDIVEIEYGIKDFDIKTLIKEVKNAKIVDYPTIDIMKAGEQTLNFVLLKDNYKKDVQFKVNIVDTQLPVIKFKKDTIEITEGDVFDVKSNVESVKDLVDGDLTFVENIEVNSKGVYGIVGNVNIKKLGNYTIKVIAVDINGNKSEKEFIVKVKEKQKNSGNNDDENSSSEESANFGNSNSESTSNEENNDVTPPSIKSAGYKNDYAQHVVTLINRERIAVGLSELPYSSDVQEIVNIRAKEIITDWSHGGKIKYDPEYLYGEILAKQWNSPEATVNGWMNSKGHRELILDQDTYNIVSSCYYDGTYYYWVVWFRYK